MNALLAAIGEETSLAVQGGCKEVLVLGGHGPSAHIACRKGPWKLRSAGFFQGKPTKNYRFTPFFIDFPWNFHQFSSFFHLFPIDFHPCSMDFIHFRPLSECLFGGRKGCGPRGISGVRAARAGAHVVLWEPLKDVAAAAEEVLRRNLEPEQARGGREDGEELLAALVLAWTWMDMDGNPAIFIVFSSFFIVFPRCS